MKKKIVILSIVFVLVVALIVIAVVVNGGSKATYDITDENVAKAYSLLYDDPMNANNRVETYYDFMRANSGNVDYDEDISLNASMASEDVYTEETFDGYTGQTSVLEYSDAVSYSFNVSDAGYYNIVMDYFILDNPLTNYNIKIETKGASDTDFKAQYNEAEHVDVPIYWADETKEFSNDRYGDQTLPQCNRIEEWNKLDMYDNKYTTSTPLLFYFDSGVNEIRITMMTSNGRLVTGDLDVVSPVKAEKYVNYIANVPNTVINEQLFIEINAIDYISKNSSFVRMGSVNESSAKPFDNLSKKLNIIDGTSWQRGGQEITYSLNVETTGLYNISFHYKSNKDEYNVFRNIYIDGEIPFEECINYEFENTGSAYANHTLGSKEEDFKFYLTAGTHELTFRNAVEPIVEATTKIQVVIDHINSLALEVLNIVGAEIDENRTMNIIQYIPNTEKYLNAYDTLLKSVVNDLAEYSNKGGGSASFAYVQRAISLLQGIIDDPTQLPIYLERLYSGSSSINQLLGNTLESIYYQPMDLERVYVTTKDAPLPAANSNFFASIGTTIVQLWQTFFSGKYQQSFGGDEINIWVSRPLTYINIMQKMIDADYNQTHDVKVKLSALPDASKLTLSVAANNAPDAVLGIASHIPYDLALRGGVYNLTEFDDFWGVADRFPAGLLLSYLVSDEDGDRIYALPETVDFNAVVYREDIFNKFGIDSNVNTWDDMIEILPPLQRNGMNFYMPISADNATKWYYQTSPLILQNGGSLYADDGLTVAVDSQEAIAGLTTLTRLFIERALPTQVPLFYSKFRNGTLPMGTVDFNTYLQLKNAAPEIAGKWKMILPLGTERTVGSETYIDRTYIAAGTTAAILKTTSFPEESWEFLKWWTSAEIQTSFGYMLQSTYGPEYVWLSSNLDAIADSQIEEEDKQIIIESLKWITEVTRNPGQYIVERGISNIWTNTVLSNTPLRVAIGNESTIMNREITRRLKEFGYLDNEGNVLKEYYVRNIAWIKEQIAEHLGGDA